MSSYEQSIRETAARRGWLVSVDGSMLVVVDLHRPYEVEIADEDGEVDVWDQYPTVRHRLGGLAEAAYDTRTELARAQTELARWYGECGYRDVVQILEGGAEVIRLPVRRGEEQRR